MGFPRAETPSKTGEQIVLRCGDMAVAVYLTEHHKARRLSLRVDPVAGRVVLVKPRRASKSAAVAFASDKIQWISDRLAELPQPVPFEPGAVIPVYGRPHVIDHHPDARRGVWIDEGRLCVSGPLEHLSRRTHDWMRAEARRVIYPTATSYAEQLDKRVTGVSIRDTKSRWGSCTVAGKLSFSWRLMLTPEPVLKYVVAHEVAHLQELNHSGAFWRVVDRLVSDRAESTQWLKTQGADLHRYGLKRPADVQRDDV